MSGQYKVRCGTLFDRAKSYMFNIEKIVTPSSNGMPHPGDDVKLAIVLTGIPGQGKSIIGNKLERMLNWVNVSTKTFKVGDYRRLITNTKILDPEIFNPDNLEGYKFVQETLSKVVDDVLFHIKEKIIKVGVIDASVYNDDLREIVEFPLKMEGVEIIWIEVSCPDQLRNEYIKQKLSVLPPNDNTHELYENYMKIVSYISQSYQPLEKPYSSYIKYHIDNHLPDEYNLISGYYPSKIMGFMINMNLFNNTIYLSCPGESQSEQSVLGGDPSLSKNGQEYSANLFNYFKSYSGVDLKKLIILTSTYKRSKETSEAFGDCEIKNVKALDDISVGRYNGRTYEDIEHDDPDFKKERSSNGLSYRYPGGESYLDLTARLEPVILEIERIRNPILIISHHAIIQCLKGYFCDITKEETPYIEIPYHTLLKLTRNDHGYTTETIELGPKLSYKLHKQ